MCVWNEVCMWAWWCGMYIICVLTCTYVHIIDVHRASGAHSRILAWFDVGQHMISKPPRALVRLEKAGGGDVRFEVLAPPPERAATGETARGLCESCKEAIGEARRAARAAAPAGKGGGGGGKDGGGGAAAGGGPSTEERARRAAMAKGGGGGGGVAGEIGKATGNPLRRRMEELERETRRRLLAENPDLREQ